MKRLLLLTLLLLSSSPVYAEWVLKGIADYGFAVYVNPDTIRRKGDLVKMWHLFDYKTVETVTGISYLSNKVQSEYDCAEERSRQLAVVAFSGNMGKGAVVHTNSDEGKWEPVAPDSVTQRLWKVVCGKQ